MTTCKGCTQSRSQSKRSCKNTWSSSRSWPSMTIAQSALNNNSLTLLLLLPAAPCFTHTGQLSTIDSFSSCVQSTASGDTHRLSVPTSTTRSCGRLRDIISNTRRTSFSLLSRTGKRMDSNPWTVQDIVWCSIWCSTVIETYRSGWQTSEYYTATNCTALCQDWLVCVGSSRTMHTYSACLSRSNSRY